MACLLAFVLLGDVAWAVARHSVGTEQLKNNAVTSKKIRNGAVTAAKIANGAVTGADIKPTSFDFSVYAQAVSAIPAYPGIAPNRGGATASCPVGKKAISGGGLSDNNQNDVLMGSSMPVNGTAGPTQDGTFNGWRASWSNYSASPVAPIVYVVCLG